MTRSLSWPARTALLGMLAGLVVLIPASSAALTVTNRSLPGVVRGSTLWELSESPPSVTISFSYGTKPLTPVMGDWDGNGSKTAGTFEAGTFRLRNSNTSGPPELEFVFGDPRGFPVAGDFDGNGTDDVALFRNGLWQVHYLGAGAPPDTSFPFGAGVWPGTVPVAGDWNGDGTDGVGTYGLTTGQWNLRNTASAGAADAGSFIYNPGPATPYGVVGDWDANGTDTVGVKATGGSAWNLRNSNNAGLPDITFNFGEANDFPVVWKLPPPVANNDTFSGAVGNTTFGVGTSPPQPSRAIAGNVLTNDTDPTGHAVTVVPGTLPTTNGGSVVMNANGTFTYNPPAGFIGSDTFNYTATNGFGTDVGTVTVVINDRVWYVNSSLAANGNGTSISPFNTLASVTGPAGPTAPGDYIFLFGSASNYTGGIVLKANQTLVGQSAGLVVGGNTLVTASGANPVITNTAPNPAITLAENDTIRGISVQATGGPGVSATNVNAATIASSVVIGSTNGDGLFVSGGSGAFNVAAPITTSGTGHSVNIQNRTGGTVTLSGAINDTGTGVRLASNTGTTINITGGLTLSGAGAVFAASGGGTVNVTGNNNTIGASTPATGPALSVVNTTIGASGLIFKKISSTGGTNGILLTNTGSAGGLTVTGTGTVGSGGTIQNATDSGIQATSTTNLNLSWMTIQNNGNALNEGGVRLVNALGTGQLTSSTVTGSFEDNVYLSNSSGTSTFTIQGPNCSISDNNSAQGNTGISGLATATSTMNVIIDGCRFTGNRSDAVHVDTADASAMTATITDNVFMGGAPNQGNIGIDVTSAGTSTITYDVANNQIGKEGATIAPLLNTGINVFAAGTSTATGKVVGNTVHNAGAGFSGTGIRVFQQDSGTINAKVDSNTVSNVGFDFGIDATNNGSGVGPSTGKLNIGVTNNDVSVLSTAINGIRVRGRRDTNTCARITGNIATTNGGAAGLSVSQANTAVYRLEIVPPPPLGPLTDAQAAAELASLNPGALGVDASSATGNGITGVDVNTCTSIPA